MYSGNQSKRVYFIIRNFETLNWFCFCSLLLRCLIVVAEYYKCQKLNTTIWEPPIRYCHHLQPTANCRHLFWWFNTRSKLAKQTSLFIKRYISTKILYGVGWRSRSSYKDIYSLQGKIRTCIMNICLHILQTPWMSIYMKSKVL